MIDCTAHVELSHKLTQTLLDFGAGTYAKKPSNEVLQLWKEADVYTLHDCTVLYFYYSTLALRIYDG